MPRPPEIIVKAEHATAEPATAEPATDSIYAPGSHSDLETPIYIATVDPDMSRAPGNIQHLRYNKVEDNYHEILGTRGDDSCCEGDCCEGDTLCIICFCCCMCDCD